MTITPCERLKTQLASAPESGAALPKALLNTPRPAPSAPPSSSARARSWPASRISAAVHARARPRRSGHRPERGARPRGGPRARRVHAPRPVGLRRRRARRRRRGRGRGARRVRRLGHAHARRRRRSRGRARARDAHVAVEKPNRGVDPATAKADDGLAVRACLDATTEVSCDVGRAITTPIGETRAFRLTDGTLLHVDQGTELTLDPDARALKITRGGARPSSTSPSARSGGAARHAPDRRRRGARHGARDPRGPVVVRR